MVVSSAWLFIQCHNQWISMFLAMSPLLSATSTIQCESKNPYPWGYLTFFPKEFGIFNQFFLHICILLSTLDHKFLLKYLELWQSYVCHTERDHQTNFYISVKLLTSKFAYWANDVIVDVMSYPTCLLTINKAISDLRKRRNARVLADGGHFEHIMWTG